MTYPTVEKQNKENEQDRADDRRTTRTNEKSSSLLPFPLAFVRFTDAVEISCWLSMDQGDLSVKERDTQGSACESKQMLIDRRMSTSIACNC